MYLRNCPNCNKEILHKNKRNRDESEHLKKFCSSCNISRRNKLQKGKPISEKAKKSFETKDYSFMRTDEYRNNMRKAINNSNKQMMHNRNLYDIWLEKYGKEIADKKSLERNNKISLKTSGKNNPMYGKPSPTGSGNGWCGWYKNWHFRSLLELSYMINIIERFNLKWENAEQKKYSVPYKINGVDHVYYPDFVINDKYIVDCKPKNLCSNELNVIKKNNAIPHFQKIGLKFKFVRCRRLTNDEIIKLYKDKKIRFTNKYELKFREKY